MLNGLGGCWELSSATRYARVKRYKRLFDNYVRALVELFSGGVTLVLFGSRAEGTHKESSDFDLAVILPLVTDPLELTCKLYQLRPRGLPVDLLVLNVSELEDPIVKKMLAKSTVIYDGLKLFKKA